MDNPTRSLVERQVRRVRRRLFIVTVLHSLALCWSAALLASALWFLVRPFLFEGTDDVWRWTVPGVLLGLGTLAGIVLATMRTPNFVAAALALDERFALRERVTTLLMLPPDHADTSAGQALLQDVGSRVTDLPVASRFPIRLSVPASLVPVGAAVLALAACLFEPFLGQVRLGSTATASTRNEIVDSKEVQKQLENLRKVSQQQPKDPDLEKSKELQELEKEWDKLVKDLDTRNKEEVRERVNEMRNLEQKIKDRIGDLKGEAQKTDTLKKLLEKLATEQGDKQLKDGLAKDFEDALAKGDFKKAKEVMDKLANDLKNNKLSKEQMKELAEQFKQVQDKMKKVMEKNETLKQLKKDFEEGRIDKEQLDREMEKFKEFQELSNLLGECKECLGLDAGQASSKLGKLASRFEEMELNEKELEQLLGNQEALDEAMLAMLQALGEEGDQQGDGLGGGGPPGRRRPISPDDPDSKITPERSKAQVEASSQQRLVGYSKGGTFNRIPAKEVGGAFKQAVQDAPEAIERQRIPDDAADIARGYFRKLGNQK